MAENISFDIIARDRASATFNRIAQSTATLESRFTRFSRAAAGVAGSLVGAEIGKSVLEAADKFELSRSRLETITKNVGANFGDLSKQVDAADKRMAAFGFTAADTEGSLASLESVTRDPTKAIKDLALAADIARGRNIGLSESTLILQRVETGHIAQLAKLGIATKDAAGHTLTQAQALQMLTDLYGGAASHYADTFAGKQAAVRAELQNSAAQIGVALLPAAVDLANAIQHDLLPPLIATVQWFDRNRKTIEPLVKAVLFGVAAWKAYSLAVRAAEAITRTFGATAATSATKVVAANSAEAASAKATSAAFLSEGAAIGAGMAGGLGRGAAVGSAFLRGAPRAAALGALVGGQYVGGRYGNELSAVGTLGLIAPRAGLVGAAGIGAFEATTALLNKTPAGDALNYALNHSVIPHLFGVSHFGSTGPKDENAEVLKNLGPAAKKLVGAYGSVDAALEGMRTANQANLALEKAMAGAFNTTATAAVKSADAIAAHAQKTVNFKSAQDAVRQAMHDAAQTAADNGRAIQGNSDAALANRSALMSQVTAVLNVISVMKANGSSAANQKLMLDVLTQAVENNATKIYGNKAAVDDLLRSLGLMPEAVNAAAEALATLPAITQAAFSGDNVTQGAIHQLNQAVTQAKTVASKQGKDIANSFSDGYSPVVAKVPKAAKAAADKAAQAFNALKDQMKSDLQSIASAVDSTRSSVAGFADFAAQGTDALGASGTNSDVAGQLKAKASRLEQFSRLFNQLDRAGLDAHLMAQFAQIGPDAIPAMQALLHSGKRGIGQVNRIEQRIQTAAGSVATTSAREENSGLIHKDLTTLPAKLGREFAKGLKNVHVSVSLRETDRKNGIAVVTAP